MSFPVSSDIILIMLFPDYLTVRLYASFISSFLLQRYSLRLTSFWVWMTPKY